ncbi:MAG: hypothetical protein RMZ41_021180 [Nostoc sp. DedVER02]|uniref:hypothetical protein n=1 Tax=unclassified Nostoc TaxID=2593658 RepID=UPI002AD454B9|nr:MULTISPECIES: hypothetical protein [unclassified Nostoc]MDZ7986472.1 hypothetical protein [Nostoc sp. DedVER02]MDZ8114028.1 hypothetical protein [Nostoc sp. DedVER01b]
MELCDACGGLCLRTLEILQAIAFFNKRQRKSDRTLEICRRSPFLTKFYRRREDRGKRERSHDSG